MDTSEPHLLFQIAHWSWPHKKHLLAENLRTSMKGMTVCDALALILKEIIYLLNYKSARSFTDFRTTSEFKYIQHLQDHNKQE